MNYEEVFERWNELSKCFKSLEEKKTNYFTKLEEIAKLQNVYMQDIAKQKCEVGVIERMLERTNIPEDKNSSIESLKKSMAQHMTQLVEMEDHLHQENDTPLKIIVDNINTKIHSKNEKALQLCQLPPEMLETIALCLPNKTIKSLKCSSKQFYSDLDTKKVLEKMLLYPVRYYESDLLSGSTAEDVAKVVSELSAGGLTKIQAFYKLQQARVQLSHRENFQTFDEIVLPSDSISQLLELVTDDGQRWIFVRDENMLHIWNITSRPRAHDVVQLIFEADILSLLPQGYVIVQHEVYGTAVYQFQKPNYNLDLMYRLIYHENICINPSAPLTRNKLASCCVVGDFFVASDHQFETLQQLYNTSLHIWKISDGRKLAQVGLHIDITNIIKSHQPRPVGNEMVICFEKGSNNSLSTVIVTIVWPGYYLTTIFSLKNYSFTHILPISFWNESHDLYYRQSYIYEDKVCCVSSLNNSIQVSVYSLKKKPINKSLDEGYLLKTFAILYEWDDNTRFTESKMIFHRSSDVIVIVSLDDYCLPEVEVNVYKSNYILGLIEPHLLLLFDDEEDEFVIYNITNDTTVFTRELPENRLLVTIDYYRKLIYPSKIGLIFGNKLHIFYVN